ncbi:KRAB-A domain-containing protein 2-like [Aphis craccivora]|uniref:KRAB-A domain-containing protein 2-like n=1 Tax=Aphis craccivora TaxID=307492 RepID=A0A6G0VLK7_APHCR|nr:KRAB-A domain-containing protein 2-like [Aphis craccivora]
MRNLMQDYATKYLYLRPFTSKRATEVAHELLKIFLEQGAPQILQSDNGREFTAKIIEELAELWPECKIVYGRPRHPQSQGSVERSNQDVENILRAWVVDNKSTKWSIVVYFVQWQKNISHHRILGRSPYRALFGTEPKVGHSSTNLPAEIIQKLSSEEDFENILQDNTEHNVDNIPSKKKKYCNINNICSVCEKSGSELQCTICKRNIHSDNYSYSINNSNDIENNCLLCNNEKQIKVNRIEFYKRQTIAAQKMAENSEKLFKELKVGDQIVLSVPKVDRGPLDSQNINGLVIDKIYTINGVYEISTDDVGIIKNWCSKEELQLVSNNGLEDSKIQKDKFVSIREAVVNL